MQNFAEKLGPAAGNLRRKMEGAVEPFVGTVSGDNHPPAASTDDEPVDIPHPIGGPMLAGMEINGKPVELSCHEACLPLCSAIGGSDIKMPCWLNDNSSKIFGKKVDTPASAAIVALVVLLAMALGFIGGQKIDVKSVRRKAASKADKLQKSVEGRQD